MKRLLRLFFYFEKFEIKTKLTKESVLECVELFKKRLYNEYRARIKGDKFTIYERLYRQSENVYVKNSLAPVYSAKITESDGVTVISGAFSLGIRHIMMLPFFIMYSLIYPLLFLLPISHFAFGKRVDVMKEAILNEITAREKREGVI